MPIVDEVTTQLKAAMKARDAHRVAALRQMRTAFLNEMKKDGAESLSDEACVAALRRLEKQRKESIEAFAGAGREAQAEAERAELAVIQEFLPRLADEARTRAWVEAAIAQTGASGPKDMGRVMGALMRDHRDELDGNLARQLVQRLLAG
jgi:uncharacterized protein YqeY